MTLTDSRPRATEQSATTARLACAAAGLLALVPMALCHFSGTTGEAITASLVANATGLTVGAGVAAAASALMMLAATRLGRSVGGATGSALLATGVAVAVLFAAYYAAFGAGAAVATMQLSQPGPGVGEGTALLVNLAELTRYGAGLALTTAAVVARRKLPAGIWITAAVLAAATLVPMTSWVAAALIPLWLAIAAALARR